MMMDSPALGGGKLCFSWRQIPSEEDAVYTVQPVHSKHILNLNNLICARVCSSPNVSLMDFPPNMKNPLCF